MSARTLKMLLAVSVALNLFLLGAGATMLVTRALVQRQVEDVRKPGRSDSVMALVARADPAVQQRVRLALRASATAARPDFEAARTARREAVALAAGPQLDRAAVQALLEQSRLAEMRGRARLESGALEVLATLEPDDRRSLSPILARHGPRGKGRRSRSERAAAAPG
jgi:uncharacterized membrane protein